MLKIKNIEKELFNTGNKLYQKILIGFDINIDELILKECNKYRKKISKYNPYDVENLLNECSILIDRCIGYRDKFNQLKGSSIQFVLEHELFLETASALEFIELQESIEKQRSAEREGQIKAREVLQGSRNRLELASYYVAGGTKQSLDLGIKWEAERKPKVLQKWEKTRQFHEYLLAAHGEPGHPLAYAHQAGRIKELLLSDLKELVAKCTSIEKGVMEIFQLDIPLQFDKPINDEGDVYVLENILLWIRSVMDVLGELTYYDIQFEHIISGCHRMTRRDGRESVFFGIDELRRRMGQDGGGMLEFDFRRDEDGTDKSKRADLLFDGQIEHLRTKGVGLSFGIKSPAERASQLYRWAAVVYPPDTRDPFTGKFQPRTPIIIENVALNDPYRRVAIYSPKSLININPRGLWKVQTSLTLNFPGDNSEPRYGLDTNKKDGMQTKITDVKLHLLLAGKPRSNTSAWSDFWP